MNEITFKRKHSKIVFLKIFLLFLIGSFYSLSAVAGPSCLHVYQTQKEAAINQRMKLFYSEVNSQTGFTNLVAAKYSLEEIVQFIVQNTKKNSEKSRSLSDPNLFLKVDLMDPQFEVMLDFPISSMDRDSRLKSIQSHLQNGFQSTFETGKSNAQSPNHTAREQLESLFTGFQLTPFIADGESRDSYSLGVKQLAALHPKSAYLNNLKKTNLHSGKWMPPHGYGNTTAVFENDVKNSSIYSGDDSLSLLADVFNDGSPSANNYAKYLNGLHNSIGTFSQNQLLPRLLPRDYPDRIKNIEPWFGYFEVLIFGKLPFKKVKHLLIIRKDWDDIEDLKMFGVPIYDKVYEVSSDGSQTIRKGDLLYLPP